MRTTAAAFALLGAAHAATEPAVQLGLPYDVDLAQTGVLYASAAYCPPANVEAWSFKSSKCNALPATLYASHVAPKTGAFALVAIDSGLSAVVVAFKGTNGTAQDFEHDLAGGEFSFSPCTVAGTDLPGNAHSGFCSYYNSLVDDGLGDSIAAAVAAHPSHDLVFTGHSLGGAAAALAASDAHYRLKVSPARTLLYTFGEPRTGTKGFAQGVEAAVDGAYRVVHSADWIAHMPPCCSLMIGGLSTCQDWSDCPYHHANEGAFFSPCVPRRRRRCCAAVVAAPPC